MFDDSTGIGTVSITNYAQGSLGDVVFVELPALKTKVKKGGSKPPKFLRVLGRLIIVNSLSKLSSVALPH